MSHERLSEYPGKYNLECCLFSKSKVSLLQRVKFSQKNTIKITKNCAKIMIAVTTITDAILNKTDLNVPIWNFEKKRIIKQLKEKIQT